MTDFDDLLEQLQACDNPDCDLCVRIRDALDRGSEEFDPDR